MSDDANIPAADECERRCQEFAAITGTDTALAMFYLQDRDWSLDRALNSYFEENASSTATTSDTPVPTGATLTTTTTAADETDGQVRQQGCRSLQPFRIRVMSWNIDGLDGRNLRSRTIGVCNTINREDPHIVLLQEVVSETEDLLQELCPLYQLIPAGDGDYFTAMLAKIENVHVEETKVLPFPNTVMSRNLLSVKCTVKGEKFVMMTSHLESCRDYSKQRKEQLSQTFTYVQKREPDRTVVYGGDLNLRDRELTEIGGIPEGMYDIWEMTGKRPEAKFTWDQQRNDNLEIGNKIKPRCRFDRMYIRPAVPRVVEPVYLELCGLERLKSCQRFCSDHWGLLAHLNILAKVPK